MVLSVKDNSIYDNLVKTIRETWDNDKVDGFTTIYYYGNNGNSETTLIGDELFVKSPEGMSTMCHKVIESLEYALNNFEFDYVFKMNCSSYLNKKMLKDFLVDKPLDKYCCGIIGTHNDINFTSGCGSILSRDIVDLIVKNKENWNHSLIEDVSIGKILSQNNILLNLGERVDITNGIEFNLINKKCYHYRCKNSNREIDSQIMKELYKKYKNNGKN
jgi:hypothetical protein